MGNDLPPSPEEFGDEFEEVAKVEPEQKKVAPRSKKSGLIDLASSQDMLTELIFVSQEINAGAEKLKGFSGIDEITKKLENLQNLKIDTSSFEQKFDLELAKLSEKIKGITDKVDLSELDEIDKNIDEINKKMKRWRFKTMLLVSVGFFAAGFFANDAFAVIKNTHQVSSSQVSKTEAQIIENNELYDDTYEMIFIPPGMVVYRSDSNKEIRIKEGATIKNAMLEGDFYRFDNKGVTFRVSRHVVQKIK